MIDPNNIRDPYEYLTEPPKVIKIDELPDCEIPDWDFNDPKEYTGYIRTLKGIVRKSFEYSSMVSYLKEYADMRQCAFFENISSEDGSGIKIEIHHGPFSLEDICGIVFRKRCEFGEDLDEFMVAKEIMYLHYNMCVGLIPLAATVHQLVGNRYLFISPRKYYGNYKDFVNRYDRWILPEQHDILDRLESVSEDKYDDMYKTILSRQFIYADMSGAYESPTTNEIIDMLKGRISETMNNP